MTRRTKPKTDQVIVYTSAGGRMALRPFAEEGPGRHPFRIAMWCDDGSTMTSVLGVCGVFIKPPYNDTAALAWLLEGEDAPAERRRAWRAVNKEPRHG